MTLLTVLLWAGMIGVALLVVDETLIFFKDKEQRRRTLRQFGLFGVYSGLVGVLLVVILYFMYAG